MSYKRKGFPEVGEAVMCTVKKILPNSIFANLDEFENKEGMIHISEISPGRIRNIRDYVREGKKIVCKVLNVNKEKGYIDLSLRRVPLSVRRNKIEESKQEDKAEKILEIVANNLKEDIKEIHEKVGYKVVEEHGTLNDFLQEISIGNTKVIKDLKIPEKYVKELIKVVKEKIKIPEIKISSELTLKSYSSEGIEKIKEVLNNIKEIAKNEKYDVKVTYLGAPRYMLTVKSSDFKSAEKMLENLSKNTMKTIESTGCEGEFKRK